MSEETLIYRRSRLQRHFSQQQTAYSYTFGMSQIIDLLVNYLCLRWQLVRVTLLPCPKGVTVTFYLWTSYKKDSKEAFRFFHLTILVFRVSKRKCRETEQQPYRTRAGHWLSWCLVSSMLWSTYPSLNVPEGKEVYSARPVQFAGEVCHVLTPGADRVVQGQQLHGADRRVVPLGAAHHQQGPYRLGNAL